MPTHPCVFERRGSVIQEDMPRGLKNWLAEKDWTVISWGRMTGGFTAPVFRLRVRKKSGVALDMVYKQLIPGRTRDFDLPDDVWGALAAYAPRRIVRIHEDEEKGMLMEDAGQPIKSILAAVDPAQRATLVQDAVKLVAQLHVKLEQNSHAWIVLGVMDTYPVESARAWGNDAVNGLARLTEQGFHGLDMVQVAQVRYMVRRFYPSLPQWLKGRSTVTHGDPHMENLLLRQKQFCLIDWEYACITVPQRDITILLQDVLTAELHQLARKTYWDYLRRHGWSVDDQSFETTYQACLFDNTLMMLGWEIFKFHQGFLSQMELESIVATKLKWLQGSFDYLSNHAEF